MVGNWGKPTWSDATVGYAAFYHLLQNTGRIVDGVNAMRAASGNDEWVARGADEIQRSFLDYVASLNTQQVQAAVEVVANVSEVTPDQKALAGG
jgi:hypothetical protein